MRKVYHSKTIRGACQAVLSVSRVDVFHPLALHINIKRKDHRNIKVIQKFIPVLLPGMHRSDQLFSQPPDHFHQVSGHEELQLLHLSSFEAHLPINR